MNAETTRDELFRLATGVVDPAFRPMFLDADNRNAGRAPSLKAAWDSDRAFCCGLRSEVVPVDIDSAQVHLLPAYRDAIEASKQAFVEAASSGTDSANRHFFIWAPADTDHEHLVDTLRHMGGREPVRIGQPIRLPGVRHRCHSTRSTPVDRRQVAAMLSAITDHDTKPQDVIADRLMGRLSPPWVRS